MTRPAFTDRFDLAALDPYWARIGEWWVGRSFRERVLLAVLAAIALVALILLVFAPLAEARAEARADLRSAALLEARLQSGEDLAGLGQFRTGTPSAIVVDSAAAARLELANTQPVGNDVRVTFENATFDGVVAWIADVEATSDLRLKSAQLDGQAAPGLVSATLVLGQ